MEKEIQQYTSVKDWEYEARKQIEQRFLSVVYVLEIGIFQTRISM